MTCDNNPWYACGCPEHTDKDHCHERRHGGSYGTMIHLPRPEVLYKVANAATIAKDSIPDEDGTHTLRRSLEDLMDEGNIDCVTDLLDEAFADLLEWLDGRLDQNAYDCDIDVDECDEYIIMTRKRLTHFKAVHVLRPHIVAYMVDYVLWQWLLRKGFAAQATAWMDLVAMEKEKINNALVGSRAKRPLSPF